MVFYIFFARIPSKSFILTKENVIIIPTVSYFAVGIFTFKEIVNKNDFLTWRQL